MPVSVDTERLASGRHIVIGGGTGFIGSALARALVARGDHVTLISRQPGPGRMTWADLERDGLPRCDAVVNFAGQHILDLRRRWDDTYRQEVVRSRVDTTRALVKAMNESATPPLLFISTAGKCFYGTRELDQAEAHPELDEESQPMGRDFPSELVALWEAAADGVDTRRIRHAKVRIGVVLGAVERTSLLGRLWQVGRARGFLPLIRLPFCLGVGAVIGRGSQPLPWVHIADVVGILLHVIDQRETQGRYNAVAPGIVTNRQFIEALARRLRRPILWSVPEWLVRRVVGDERSSILLRGQLVKPRRTLAAGYRFIYPDLVPALEDLVYVTI
ncbi:TIGR01777 family oxidoreductase [Zavarzinia sp. CC-PAN008]|uniref:TIGR01777 family oxidoreductase n=1 Tax=Zavarzinia sp. CC-PAN008 TaxID=3243332 RepID=UPI003F745072